jgi:hypothetical protein
MPLIRCPDCHREISDRAPLCINCGAPRDTGVNEPGAPRPAHVQAEVGPRCPFCKHSVPIGATVCSCGARYGYQMPGVERDLITGFGLVGGGAIASLVVPFGEIIGWFLAVAGAGALLRYAYVVMRGKGWWR